MSYGAGVFGRWRRNRAIGPHEPDGDGTARRNAPAADPAGNTAAPTPHVPPPPASGVSVGGANYGAIQHVSGHDVSQVSQSATIGDITSTGTEDVRVLLDRFRAELALHQAELRMADTMRAMTSDVEAGLDDPAGNEGPLRAAAQALPALVAGTAVQEGGQALAAALGSLLG